MSTTFKVGDLVKLSRFSPSGHLDHSWTIKIVRETPTRWVLANGDWIKKGTNIVMPRYIDYTTKAERVDGAR